MFKKITFSLVFSLILLIIAAFTLQPLQSEGYNYVTHENLTYPQEMEDAVLLAAERFPEINKHNVNFVYDAGVTSSVMQAQPQPFFMFESNERRSYVIKMRPYLTNGGDSIEISSLPRDVLSGWLSHELGHVQDYLKRDKIDMAGFAFNYLTSEKFMTDAECRADSFAAIHGCAPQLIQMKKFIQSNDLFENAYKNKINTLYPDTLQVLRFCKETTVL